MTALAATSPHRRRACPGLSMPMATGDGLLVRLRPIGTITLAAFAALCAAGRLNGNGVIEVTARGSIQIRGLSLGSASRFAATVAALGIAANNGVPVVTNPLAGLDPREILDANALAADLRRAMAGTALAAEIAPKISIAIDGGGTFVLDDLSADIRLCAKREAVLRLSLGGDGPQAAELGFVATADGAEAAMRLLKVMARRGCESRVRDVLAAEGMAPFRTALADLLLAPAPARDAPARPCEHGISAIGPHRLRDGALACGLGLAFGHADAHSLERLAEAAATAGGLGVRAAPDRMLMIVGLAPTAAPAFAAAAERLGFIVRADDPRRRVVACAGAPVCSSAHLAARAVAPQIAAVVASHPDRSFIVHISGCSKGCAHPAPAALTVVGTAAGCGICANGSAHDTPTTIVTEENLPAAVAKLATVVGREGSHV